MRAWHRRPRRLERHQVTDHPVPHARKEHAAAGEQDGPPGQFLADSLGAGSLQGELRGRVRGGKRDKASALDASELEKEMTLHFEI